MSPIFQGLFFLLKKKIPAWNLIFWNIGAVKAIASSFNGVENNYEFLWAFKLHTLDPIQTCYYSKGVICGVRLEQNLDLLKASKWRSVKPILKGFCLSLTKTVGKFWFPTVNLTSVAKILEKFTTFPISKFWKGKKEKTWWRHINGIRKVKKTQHQHQYTCLVIKELRFLKTAKKRVHWLSTRTETQMKIIFIQSFFFLNCLQSITAVVCTTGTNHFKPHAFNTLQITIFRSSKKGWKMKERTKRKVSLQVTLLWEARQCPMPICVESRY